MDDIEFIGHGLKVQNLKLEGGGYRLHIDLPSTERLAAAALLMVADEPAILAHVRVRVEHVGEEEKP